MKNTIQETPKIYVGTYKKYNEGSLAGEWVDLTQFKNKEDFFKYCYKLHDDEVDPELMFQDFEYFPEEFYSECSISDNLWEWIALEDDQKEILDAYFKCFGGDFKEAMAKFEDKYFGHYESFRDFVVEHFEENTDIPPQLEFYIDYDAVERNYDLDFIFQNGRVFYRQ